MMGNEGPNHLKSYRKGDDPRLLPEGHIVGWMRPAIPVRGGEGKVVRGRRDERSTPRVRKGPFWVRSEINIKLGRDQLALKRRAPGAGCAMMEERRKR